MTATGLGVDGYVRYQKETTYGSAKTDSMTDLPVKNDSLVTAVVENIENNNTISSRLKQDPNAGRQLISGTETFDVPPTLIGDWLNFLLGAATTSGPTDTAAYTHYWLQPLTGERISTSFTLQQAIGGDLGDTFPGGTAVAMTLAGEVGQNITAAFEATFQSYTEDVARASSFSYPSDIPFNFTMGVLNIDPTGVSNFNQDVNSFSLNLDLGYDRERFKVGSAQLSQPVFNTIPVVGFTANIDADQQFIDYARAHTEADLTLTLTHSATITGAGSTKYTIVVELPGCRLKPETVIENGDERRSMDIEFDCGYGGNTTNGTAVMFEVRLLDAATAYSA